MQSVHSGEQNAISFASLKTDASSYEEQYLGWLTPSQKFTKIHNISQKFTISQKIYKIKPHLVGNVQKLVENGHSIHRHNLFISSGRNHLFLPVSHMFLPNPVQISGFFRINRALCILEAKFEKK